MSPRILVPLLLLATLPAHAVIDAQGDGTQHLTAPADDFGWANVGMVQDLTEAFYIGGVYLGNGWMISAYHGVRSADLTGFNFGNVILGGTLYNIDAGSGVRLHNADSSPADLALFHLSSDPGLPSVTIASSPPTVGLSVSMMGNGPNRDSSQTNWIVSGSTWTETPLTGTRQGYKWAAGQSLRWGTNNVDALVPALNDSFGVTDTFYTTFNNVPDDAQAGFGDSGGGVFWKVGGQWELGGIMLATAGYANQPANTSVFGDITYAANLSSYHDQIVAIVPEPAAAGLAVLAAGGLAGRRRRR